MADTDISSRIAAALTHSPSSDAVREVITDVAAELARLTARRQDVERISLDPLASTDQADAGAAEHARLDLTIRRLQVAAKRLDERATDLSRAEEQARVSAERRAVTAERDALAEELATKYPQLAGQLVDLMKRLAASDERVHAAGVEMTAEHKARGVAPHGRFIGGTVGTLAQSLKLPAWDPVQQAMVRPLWPPERR